MTGGKTNNFNYFNNKPNFSALGRNKEERVKKIQLNHEKNSYSLSVVSFCSFMLGTVSSENRK
jgi:hypothetical protein